MKHNQAKFRALGNMGDVFTKMDNLNEAISVYEKQLILAKQIRDKGFEASAFGSLGICYRLQSRQFDKALGYHTQVQKKTTFACQILTVNNYICLQIGIVYLARHW
jgi:tetratricopeptide (TPR) repeat protein